VRNLRAIIEPAGVDIRRQLPHDLGECREDFFELARAEPPVPGHTATSLRHRQRRD
jgi:hypothetical protein